MALILGVLEAVAVFFAAYARFGAAPAALVAPGPGASALQAGVLTACVLFMFHLNDLYEPQRLRSFRFFAVRLPLALGGTLGLVATARFLVPGLGFGFWPLLEALGLVVLLLVPLRALLHHVLAARPFSRRVLVLGTTELGGKLVREMLAQPDLRDVVVGVVDDGTGAFKPALPSLRLGHIESLGAIVAGFEPDLIVSALPERHHLQLLRELLEARGRGVAIEDGIAAYERLTGKVAIEYASPRAVLFSRDFEASWLTLGAARALSIAVAAVGLVVLLPLLLPVALLIKLDSDGPVFFLHERVGLGGRPFKLLKFRTMRPGGVHSEWAADNGHRTTRVGHWLRRFRIDELPQFLNILRGEMNLVGPRPHPVTNVELFTDNIPYYGLRCSVRPGVTGWAQIRYGYANNLKEETEKMRYDLHYIKHLSLGLDLRILFETVKVVLNGGRSAALADEPGARVAPIYFGLERPRTARAAAEPAKVPPLAARPLTPAPEAVAARDERRTPAARTPSSPSVMA